MRASLEARQQREGEMVQKLTQSLGGDVDQETVRAALQESAYYLPRAYQVLQKKIFKEQLLSEMKAGFGTWNATDLPSRRPERLGYKVDNTFIREVEKPRTQPLKDSHFKGGSNPLTEGEWWLALRPSTEEFEAAIAGFDTQKAEDWLARYSDVYNDKGRQQSKKVLGA